MIRGAPWGEVALALWRRIDIRHLILGDLPLKAAAMGAAILLFVWATAIYSPPPQDVTQVFDGRIPVERPEVPSGFVLRGQLGDATVRLRGPEDAVRAIGQQQLRATLDVSTLAPGPDPQEAPIRVAISDDRVRIVEVIPATVQVRLERRVQRSLAVQSRLANEPPAGFQAAPATFRPQEVTVSGPESAVATVAAVLATVLFGDAPVDLAQDVRPVPVDAGGQAVEGVEVDPVAVHVIIPVQSSATTRAVPILWQLRGDVATGYWISRVISDPVAVTVSGDRAAVAALERIETATIDVTGLTAGRTFTVPFVVPSGVNVLGSQEATVGVTVVALIGTRPFPLVAIQPVNAGPDLSVSVAPGTADVVLSGSVPALSILSSDAVTATVDVGGRGPGTYTIDVTIRAPSGLTIQSVQPLRATVTIRSTRPPPTPTPSPTTTPP
ncbi:MAG TPA: CdaR family protein [Candidatus Limnocylindria bacterium]